MYTHNYIHILLEKKFAVEIALNALQKYERLYKEEVLQQNARPHYMFILKCMITNSGRRMLQYTGLQGSTFVKCWHVSPLYRCSTARSHPSQRQSIVALFCEWSPTPTKKHVQCYLHKHSFICMSASCKNQHAQQLNTGYFWKSIMYSLQMFDPFSDKPLVWKLWCPPRRPWSRLEEEKHAHTVHTSTKRQAESESITKQTRLKQTQTIGDRCVASCRTRSRQDEVEGGRGVALSHNHSFRAESLVTPNLDDFALHSHGVLGKRSDVTQRYLRLKRVDPQTIQWM